MKKTALKRRAKEKSILHRTGSVPMAKGNRLKSSPIKPRSKKRAKLMREVRAPLVREILEERPWCERGMYRVKNHLVTVAAIHEFWRVHRSTQVHEKLTRARGGDITDKDNCVALCRACHRWVHEHPAAATEEGWLEHRKADIDVIPRRYSILER